MVRFADTEGTVAFRDGETWFRVVGEITPESTPLVLVHGGPGATHQYLTSLARLARPGRPIVFYDQIGCGNSTHFRDRGAEFYTVDLYLDELDTLLAHLGVADRYLLLGQSWGGMLAAEHAVRDPKGLFGLVLSNSPASMELWVSEAMRMRAEFPPEIREALDTHERDGTIDSPEYKAATQYVYDRHVCRVVPNPPEVAAAFASLEADPTVYLAMNGPNEFFCVGSLRTWSIIDRLHKIKAPTFIVSGEFDEATPATVRPYSERISGGSVWQVIPNASHMPFVENPDAYDEAVNFFLDVVTPTHGQKKRAKSRIVTAAEISRRGSPGPR